METDGIANRCGGDLLSVAIHVRIPHREAKIQIYKLVSIVMDVFVRDGRLLLAKDILSKTINDWMAVIYTSKGTRTWPSLD